LLLPGCYNYYSEQPLSDETTSALDQRLIGQWQNRDRDRTTIRRKPGTDNTLDIASVFDGEAYEGVVYTTRIGDQWYMSIQHPGQRPEYQFLSYEFPDENTLRIGGALGVSELRKAFRRGELSGRMVMETPEMFGEIEVLILDSDPEVLRSFVEKHGDDSLATNLYRVPEQ
jgi:hypothetical protein